MRALKFLVVAMGVMIVAGTVTLVALIVQRAGGAVTGAMPAVALDLPAGTRILSVSGAGDRFAVLVEGAGEERRILLLNPRSGRVVGEVRPRP
ncbi:DUF6476 family protein [Roseococcus thiosulfatophilus]|uniref:DUF6476 family protein n=1 Tax=Roseococcus thiosulfatophilus TaxID=35813 RepID=UPI001A8CEE52|nr:DUF6476 family protein [Roseococcus thiosulfatophilus]